MVSTKVRQGHPWGARLRDRPDRGELGSALEGNLLGRGKPVAWPGSSCSGVDRFVGGVGGGVCPQPPENPPVRRVSAGLRRQRGSAGSRRARRSCRVLVSWSGGVQVAPMGDFLD